MLTRNFRCMSRHGLVAARRSQAVAAHLMSSSASAPGPATAEDPVLFESDANLRKYVLNRPSKLNSLNRPMLDLLRTRIEGWSGSNLCEIIVGTGSGKAFCAGGDVATVVQHAADKKTLPQALDFFKQEFELDYILASVPKPYVAVMDGYTMGGGFGLCMNAPFRIATEKTMFAMPETKIGYSPDVGATHFLSRMDGQLGTYLGLTGSTIAGRANYELGIATHYVPSRRIPELIARLAALEGASYDAIDATIEEHRQERTSEDTAPQLVGSIRTALDYAFKPNQVQEIIKRLAKFEQEGEPEVRGWAKDTLAALHLRSPTSLKVALHAIRKGTSMSLLEALQMELSIATAFCRGASPDFKTGVTHVLIDKSKDKAERPAWSPSTIAEVPDDKIVFNFFSADSPYLRSAPTLERPAWLEKAEPSNPMRFALPREEEIGNVVKGSDGSSSAFAVTLDQLLSRFESRRRGKEGVEEKIREVVKRRCRVEPDSSGEWLVWKS